MIELAKWNQPMGRSDLDKWLRFFKEGKELDVDSPPPDLDTPEMKQAMDTLRAFSERDKNYAAYRRRQEYLRIQHTIQNQLQEAAEQRVVLERQREQLEVELEHQKAQLDQVKAEADQVKAEADQVKAEADQVKAEADQVKAEADEAKAQMAAMAKLLKEAGIDDPRGQG